MKHSIFFLLFSLLLVSACAQGPASGVEPDTVPVPDLYLPVSCDSVAVSVYDHPIGPSVPVRVSLAFACDEIAKITPSTASTWCGLLKECRGCTFPVRIESQNGYPPRIVQMTFQPY